MAANLAINDNDTAIQYTSIGESIFTFPFPFLANDEIKVSVDQVDKTITVDYTLSGSGAAAGGTVTFNTATTIGEIITIWQDMPFKRLTGFATGAATLLGEDLNTEFVRQIRHDQQIRRDIRAALRLAPDDTQAAVDMELPTQTTRAGKALAFDAAGKPTVLTLVSSEDASLRADLASQAASLGNNLVAYTKEDDETTAGATIFDASKFPTPIRDVSRYVSDNTGVSDISAELQDAIAAAAVKGGEVIFPSGLYKCIDILLKNGVYLQGPSRGIFSASFIRPAILTAAGAGEIVKTDGLSQGANLGVIGMAFQGLGAGTAVKGVHFDDVLYGIIKYCSFNNLSDQAILLDSDTGACIIQDIHAHGCLLNRTRSQKDGVLDIDGNDHWVVRGEFNASLAALTDANARVGAIVVRGGTHMLEHVVGELSDFGIHVTGVTRANRFVNCRADLNFGNGWEIEGSSQLSNCLALRNGQETDNIYDGFLVSAGNNSFSSCQAISIAADGKNHRYGFNDTQSSDANKSFYDPSCISILHDTASFNFATDGAAHPTPTGAGKTFTDGDSTPDVDNYGTWEAFNTAATDIDFFDKGYNGQIITVNTNNTNTTFKHLSTKITTNTGADRVSVVNGMYTFQKLGTIWREVGGY